MANASRKAVKAAPASAQTVQTAIALRGGPAVVAVKMGTTTYRTKAPHNLGWWKALNTATATGPAAVAPLLLTQANPQGIPAAFIGYCLRRGYLMAATL